MPTPVSPLELHKLLSGYDKGLSNYLVGGFSTGFSLGCLDIPPPGGSIPHNLISARQHSDVVTNKIRKELALGRVIGPFDSAPNFNKYRVSPLGVVPKKKPGEFRMIHHLSFPAGQSVNDFIPASFSAVRYATIQDAISYITRSHNTVFMAKVDVESAFRIMPIRPEDRPLLGFAWEGKFYMDAVLPMGCSSSCAIFETFSHALEWIAKYKLGITEVVHVIDDFLFLAESREKCQADLNKFIAMCSKVGVPLAPDKTMGPLSVIPFLGITLDSVCMEARLPVDKVVKCRELLHEFGGRKKATLKELQSLLGFLNFACSVILPGRPFLRRLIDLTVGVPKPQHHIRLTKGAKQDLAVWAKFLNNYNGKSFFISDRFMDGDYLSLYTDAAGTIGYGALFGRHWFHGLWPKSWLQYNITILEFFPIVAAVHVWGHEWTNKSICFFTDNEALVHIINNQTSKDPNIMTLLRQLVLYCLTSNIVFTANHVPGRMNVLADKLSRSQVDGFRSLAPWADEIPASLPCEICPATLGTL